MEPRQVTSVDEPAAGSPLQPVSELFQLIYVSRLTRTLSNAELRELVAASARNNFSHGITGELLVSGRDVMQLLEGDRKEVQPLFEHISRDPRHTGIELLVMKRVSRRMFPDWGMGLSDLSAKSCLDTARLRKLVEDVRGQVNTSHFSVEARLLLNDFAQQLASVAPSQFTLA